MKLKKIASLALAGIMAVSMLAGCKDGGNGNSGSSSEGTNPTSTYTSTILNETASTTKALFAASSNTKLDQAVTYSARNCKYDADGLDVLTACYNGSDFHKVAQEYMGNAVYTDKLIPASSTNWKNTNAEKLLAADDVTVYTLLAISREHNDDYINKRVAAAINQIADVLNEKVANAGNDTYDYSISIAKADCLQNKQEADADKDEVIIGIAITLDYTADQY